MIQRSKKKANNNKNMTFQIVVNLDEKTTLF